MNIYEMSPEELNDTYQEVILKHLEAEEASRIMRSVGELKSQREKLDRLRENLSAKGR